MDVIAGRKNKRLASKIIYEAQFTSNTNDERKKYLGAVETSVKEICSNH